MIKVVIFFGIPGSGKSYIAKEIAPKFDAYFYEADEDFKDEYRIRGQISKEEGLKAKEEFYSLVIEKINKMLEDKSLVFVASALGKNKFRHRFLENFKNEILFVWVKPQENKHLDYILNRELLSTNKNEQDLRNDLKIHLKNKKASFEVPDFEYLEIFNEYTSDSIDRAFKDLQKYLKIS